MNEIHELNDIIGSEFRQVGASRKVLYVVLENQADPSVCVGQNPQRIAIPNQCEIRRLRQAGPAIDPPLAFVDFLVEVKLASDIGNDKHRLEISPAQTLQDLGVSLSNQGHRQVDAIGHLYLWGQRLHRATVLDVVQLRDSGRLKTGCFHQNLMPLVLLGRALQALWLELRQHRLENFLLVFLEEVSPCRLDFPLVFPFAEHELGPFFSEFVFFFSTTEISLQDAAPLGLYRTLRPSGPKQHRDSNGIPGVRKVSKSLHDDSHRHGVRRSLFPGASEFTAGIVLVARDHFPDHDIFPVVEHSDAL